MRTCARFHRGRYVGEGYYRTQTEKLIERLTNWQRRQWQRAGRPCDDASLRRFGRLQRDGSELYEGEILAP
jgi:hypothetical protein